MMCALLAFLTGTILLTTAPDLLGADLCISDHHAMENVSLKTLFKNGHAKLTTLETCHFQRRIFCSVIPFHVSIKVSQLH